MKNAGVIKGYVENFVVPPLKRALADALDEKQLANRFNLVPCLNSLDWKIDIRRMVIWDVTGERAQRDTDEIVGGNITFQVAFVPEMFEPLDARLKIEWGEKALKFDIEWWKSIWDKYFCYKCYRIRGASCNCQANMTIVEIGRAEDMQQIFANDTVSAMVHFKIPRNQCEKIVKAIIEKGGCKNFDEFFKKAMDFYRDQRNIGR